MARAGRKRKIGKRKPSGDIRRAAVVGESDRVKTSRQPHRRGLREDQRFSEWAESPLGRMALLGVISREQYTAGELYLRAVSAYRAALGALGMGGRAGRGFLCLTEWTGNAVACQLDQGGRLHMRCTVLASRPAPAARREHYTTAYEALSTGACRYRAAWASMTTPSGAG